MGGWGVDALVGRQTRPHHDVDLLVEVADLERLRLCLIALGFALKYTWDAEARWIRHERWSSPLEQPSAFVYGHADGREVDVHVVRHSEDSDVEMLWNVPYTFTAAGSGATGVIDGLWNVPYTFTAAGLGATGVIDGHSVRCLSREMQLQAHTGYALPAPHIHDLELLDKLS
jgi:lincosamide nucleotidyltransferase A/C/D/E